MQCPKLLHIDALMAQLELDYRGTVGRLHFFNLVHALGAAVENLAAAIHFIAMEAVNRTDTPALIIYFAHGRHSGGRGGRNPRLWNRSRRNRGVRLVQRLWKHEG